MRSLESGIRPVRVADRGRGVRVRLVLARRRAECARERGRVVAILEGVGFEVAKPPVANFVYAETGGDGRALFDALLREGVIVRPLAGFGAENAIRVTVGTSEENTFLADALRSVNAAVAK